MRAKTNLQYIQYNYINNIVEIEKKRKLDCIELVASSDEEIPLVDQYEIVPSSTPMQPRLLLVTRFDDQYEIVDILRRMEIEKISRIYFCPHLKPKDNQAFGSDIVVTSFWFGIMCMPICSKLSSSWYCGRGGREYPATELISVLIIFFI